MATSVTKRTGQGVVISWEYPVADESLIDSFLIESAPAAVGPWSSFQAVFASERSKSFSAPAATTHYRVVSVKNGAYAVPSLETVEVVIDNSPSAPTNLSVV